MAKTQSKNNGNNLIYYPDLQNIRVNEWYFKRSWLHDFL